MLEAVEVCYSTGVVESAIDEPAKSSRKHFEISMIVDLRALAQQLVETGINDDPFLNGLDRYESAWSIKVDLEAIRQAIIALERYLPPEAYDGDPPSTSADWQQVAPALIAHAIQLYGRVVGDGTRKTKGLMRGLSPDEKAAHERLKDVRNKVFAHFEGAFAMGSDPWIKEAAIVKVLPNELYDYRFVWLRTGSRPDVIEDIMMTTPKFFRNAQVMAEQAREDVHAALVRLIKDERLGDILELCNFDDKKFLEHEPAVSSYRAGPNDRDVKYFWVPEP